MIRYISFGVVVLYYIHLHTRYLGSHLNPLWKSIDQLFSGIFQWISDTQDDVLRGGCGLRSVETSNG